MPLKPTEQEEGYSPDPFSGGGVLRLFSTHPSTEQRVARLEFPAREGLASLR